MSLWQGMVHGLQFYLNSSHFTFLWRSKKNMWHLLCGAIRPFTITTWDQCQDRFHNHGRKKNKRRLHCCKVSARLVPKLLGPGQEQNPLDLSRENDSSASSSNLWLQMKPGSITSCQSSPRNTQVLWTSRKSRWCPQARWWLTFYRMQKVLLLNYLKGLHYYHGLYADKMGAFPPG